MLNRIFGQLKSLLPRHAVVDKIPKVELVRFLPDAPVIVEAGAHNGTDTLEMARLWRAGTVHAFEPLPHLYKQLNQRTKHQRNVKTYNFALGAHEGMAKFHVSSGASDASSSLLSPKGHLVDHNNVAFEREIDVQVTTLDHWAGINQIDRVDFLWLDMQGFELNTLKAAPRMLSCVRAIYTEVYLKESYSEVPLYPEVREWLSVRGFRVEREDLPWPDAGNVLFVREV